MPDIRLIQGRTSVRIQLYPADVLDIVTQTEMMCSFDQLQIMRLLEAVQLEIETRKMEKSTWKA